MSSANELLSGPFSGSTDSRPEEISEKAQLINNKIEIRGY